MRKILLLGGSAQQVPAIDKAKELGYYTVLCDYLPDNPGQYAADKFYPVSTTDREAVLKVAQDEAVNGILAYASDPAAPTAAYVAEKMGLPGNPYRTVGILCNKDKFRLFLQEHGFNAPKSEGYADKEKALAGMDAFELPVIIKPVDSSGSKGVTVLHSREGMSEAVDSAFSFSGSHRIIIEEFIEKKHEYLIGGDVFVNDGKVILWGLLNCHRDSGVNSLVPVGKSYPLCLNETDKNAVKETIQEMVDRLGIKSGLMNVELVVDKDNKVWPIDVGPRAGGNMIPDLLGLIYGIKVIEMAVMAAMGETVDIEVNEKEAFYATHNLHSDRDGVYQTIEFAPELERHIIKKCLYKKSGDEVKYFANAADALGIIFMKFDNEMEMHEMLLHINDYIFVKLDTIRGGVKLYSIYKGSPAKRRCAA